MKSNNIYLVTALCAICLVINTGLLAQTINAEVDREKIFIGEQVTLQLKVSDIDPNSKSITGWFNVPDTLNHLEVVERGKIDTVEVEGIYTFQQKVTLTSFDSGQWEIPVLSVTLADRITNKASVFGTKPIAIEVLPVDVSGLKDYHDIKEIIEVEEKNSPLVLGVLISITIASVFALYRLAVSKKRRMIKAKPSMALNKPPLQWALGELENLQKENLPGNNKVKEHYQKLSEICRQYFYYQFHQSSLQKTTGEWILDIQPMQVDQDIKTSFFQLLKLADTVKFAKYLPPLKENEGSVSTAKDMIMQTANTVKVELSNTQNKTL